jgi:hypothetical protein
MNNYAADDQSYPFDRLSGVKDITIKSKSHNFFKQLMLLN